MFVSNLDFDFKESIRMLRQHRAGVVLLRPSLYVTTLRKAEIDNTS